MKSLLRRLLKKDSRASSKDGIFFNQISGILGFAPIDISWYERAFTHRSSNKTDAAGNPVNYERLEFLGDAMLSSVIAAHLFNQVPSGDEGYLTKMRSKIVSREHLNELGRDLKLVQFIDSKIAPSHFGDNVHGNLFEALLGAIYLDRGYPYCEIFIQSQVIEPYVDIPRLEGKVISYKSLIIEWCQKQKQSFHFDVFEDANADGQRLYAVRLSIGDKVVAKARGTSKKKAEEKAAQRAYFAFQDRMTNK